MPDTPQFLDQRLSVSSMVDQVMERLEAAIISGELKGGSRISEHALATSLGISRGPLREALRRLEGRRLIERVPRIGARVVQLQSRDLEEVLTIREALEALACRLAATNITDAELDGLRQSLRFQEKKNAGEADASPYYNSPDHDFHLRIINASKNLKLIEILERDLYYLMRVHRYRSGSTPGRSAQALAEHKAIVDALAARDADRAAESMATHLAHAHANMRNINTSAIAEPALS